VKTHLGQQLLLLSRQRGPHGRRRAWAKPTLLQELLGHVLVVNLMGVYDADDYSYLVVVCPHLRARNAEK